MKKVIFLTSIILLVSASTLYLFANGIPKGVITQMSVPNNVYYATCIIHHPINSSNIKSLELILPPELDMRREESVGPVLKVYGANGKLSLMHNATEVMNFMSKNGWEFKDVYSITATGKNLINYIFVKELS